MNSNYILTTRIESLISMIYFDMLSVTGWMDGMEGTVGIDGNTQ